MRVPLDQYRTTEIDASYVEKLTQKIMMHPRTAHMLGYDKSLLAERDAS